MPSHRMERIVELPYRTPHPGGHYERERDYDDRHHPHRFHEGRRHSIDDGLGHHRPREPYPSSRKSSGVPFEEAMYNLLGTLDDSKNYFTNFEHGFVDDIQRIRSYAAPKTLNDLWLGKIEATTRSRSRRRHGNDNGPYNDDPRESMDESNTSFRQKLDELAEDFGTAVHSAPRPQRSRRDRPSGPDADGVARLQKKLNTQWTIVQPLMAKITRARKQGEMPDFLQELDQAWNILDKSRNVWETGQGQGDGDGGYGDGHGSDGGGDGFGDGS